MTERPEAAPADVPPTRRGAAGAVEPSPWRRRLRWLAVAAAVLVVASSPFWGGSVLTRLEFFRVRRVEITGVRHLAPSDVVRRLAIDTSASVWGDLRPLARRVERDPMVLSATVERRLPGTLVVHVVEKQPVALVAARGGFKVYDRAGAVLPLSPDRAALDLPLLAARDTALLRLLGEVRDSAPTVYARISEVRRVGRRELVLRLTTVPVRAMTDVRPARLADLLPVEQDLARRRARVLELDLRYREQVVARLE